MGLDDRLEWLLIGCVLGFFAGYATRFFRETNMSLKEIKEELDEVDEIVKRTPRGGHNENGFISAELAVKIALPIVVIITALAAFQSQIALNRSHDVQNESKARSTCTVIYLGKTFDALKVRTNYTENRAEQDAELQRAQAAMFSILLHEPPYSDEKQTAAAQDYFSELGEFVSASSTTAKHFDDNPYPTDKDLVACVEEHLKELE